MIKDSLRRLLQTGVSLRRATLRQIRRTRQRKTIARQSPRAYKIAMSHHCGRYEKFTNRRDFLKKAGAGFGLLALADLLQGDGLIASDIERARSLDPMAPHRPHYPSKAKAIIWLFMEG